MKLCYQKAYKPKTAGEVRQLGGKSHQPTISLFSYTSAITSKRQIVKYICNPLNKKNEVIRYNLYRVIGYRTYIAKYKVCQEITTRARTYETGKYKVMNKKIKLGQKCYPKVKTLVLNTHIINNNTNKLKGVICDSARHFFTHKIASGPDRSYVKFEIVMDAHEEYDPEHPYHGRPDQKLSDRIPFTGHFDPVLQQYTIENFDANTFQTREGAEPSIIIAGQPQIAESDTPMGTDLPNHGLNTPSKEQQQVSAHVTATSSNNNYGQAPFEAPQQGKAPGQGSDKPDYLKRLDAIPFSGIESRRAAEIREYLRVNHHLTYASLQNPEGSAGQIPWKPPHLIKFADPQKLVRDPRLNKVSSAAGSSAPLVAAIARVAQKPDVVAPELEHHTPAIKLDQSKPSMIVLTDHTLTSSGRDPRLAKPKNQVNQVRTSYNLRSLNNNALSTQTVDPLALAQKPVHKPTMERMNRSKQISIRQEESASKGNLLKNMQDMFLPSKPDKKPKGSRNIPISLAEHTAIPASCWPLLEAQEAGQNMWSKTDQPSSSSRDSKAANIAALLELVEPVSPLHDSPSPERFPQEETDNVFSLELNHSEGQQVPTAPKQGPPSSTTCNQIKDFPLIDSELHAPSSSNKRLLDIDTSQVCYGSVASSPISSITSSRMSEQDMDLDATFVAGNKRASESSGEPPAKRTGIHTLANAYKAKVEKTKAQLVLKKGGGPIDPQPSLDGNVTTEYINEVVKVDKTPIVKPTYESAPLVTLRELLPEGVIEDAPQDLEAAQLDQVFRAESIEFVVMVKPLPKDGIPSDAEWEFPEPAQFDVIMNEAFADFIDTDITRMDIIKWSSVGTQTGIGAFMANTNRLDLVKLFRETIRQKVYNGQRAESFPKQTMLSDFGITLYAHGGTIAYRPSVLLAMLLRTYQADFEGECEVLKADIYPANHPLAKRQNARIIALLPDQTFLDHLHKFPANFAFSAGFCKRLYIRGGSRIDPKAPEAKKPAKRPRFGRAAITKLLVDNQKEIMEKGEAEQDVAERMGNASI